MTDDKLTDDECGPGGMLVSFVLLSLLIFFSGRSIYRAATSSYWPIARGTIIKSWVGGGGRRGYYEFRPYASYEYTVDGEHHTSNNIHYYGKSFMWYPFSSAHKKAKKVTSRYPQGQTVDVYYCPSDPSVAMLVPGITGITTGNWLPPFMVLIPTIGGILLGILFVLGLCAMLIEWINSKLRKVTP